MIYCDGNIRGISNIQYIILIGYQTDGHFISAELHLYSPQRQ